MTMLNRNGGEKYNKFNNPANFNRFSTPKNDVPSSNKFSSNQNLFSVNKNYFNAPNEPKESKFDVFTNNQNSFNKQHMLSQRKLILPNNNESLLNRTIFRTPSGKENSEYNYVVDMEKVLKGEDKRTTLMIRNIPNKYNITILREEISHYYEGKYDFLYLPLDPTNNCNMGYAFINLLDSRQILMFHDIFRGKKWQRFNSLKECEIRYARFQGKAELNNHFEKILTLHNLNEDKKTFHYELR